MKVVQTLKDLRAARSKLAGPFGLVPTMGFLHEGHLSLVRRAKAECRSVGVSIFVNPTQFAPHEDLATYPRDLPRDLAMLEQEGVDLVWSPSVEEVYPQRFLTTVTVEKLSSVLEGSHRPGHFQGVATVVAKLMNAFLPARVYFGQKDAQQVVVVSQMVRDLNFPVRLVVCPTMREADGLAMSSRNSHLSEEQRRAAPILYRALCEASQAFAEGERRAEELRRVMNGVLSSEQLVRVQYVSVAHPETLEELSGRFERGLLSMAVYLGQVRLIDNMLVGVDGSPPANTEATAPR